MTKTTIWTLILTLVVLTLPPPSYAQNKCDAGKLKCVAKKQLCLFKAEAVALKKGEPVDLDKRQKCIDSFEGGDKGFEKGCIGKLEGKQRPQKPESLCTVTGDMASLEASTDAFVADVLGDITNGYPAVEPRNLCHPQLALCVAKKTQCLLKLADKSHKKGEPVDADKLQKCHDKFHDPVEGKGCVDKVYANQNPEKPETLCDVPGDTVALDAKLSAFAADIEVDITEATPQLSCSVEQPCPGGVECCSGTCLPANSFCEQRCSETTTVSCLADADCQWPPCFECIGTTGQTCEPQIILNHCANEAQSCLNTESCCGIGNCCRNEDQTCSSGVCQVSCPNGSFACGGSTTIICCADAQLCLSGACKTACGTTSCSPDTETCCGDVCCDTATQICGMQPGTCVARQTCTGSDVYIPSLDICCAQGATCGNSACCTPGVNTCDLPTGQCVSLP